MDQNTINNLQNLDFSCQRCSNCCRHEAGFVFLTKENAINIANHLKMTLEEFIERCCRFTEQENGKVLTLKEKQNYDCIFWNNGCIIYEVRPTQCMTYPYWPFMVNDKDILESEKYRCKGLGVKGTQTLEEKIKLYNLEKDSEYYVIK